MMDVKKSDYAREYFYENDTLKFINHEEGRVTMTGSAPEYQYHLKDHLGNVRTTFTTKEETEEAKATLETATAATEQSQFLRYDNARKVQSPLFDHTNGAATGYAERLNGSANEIYGIARSISVMPGDKINAEVYAKYIDTNSNNWTSALNTLLTQIANGTSTAGTVIDGAGYSSSTSSFSLGGLIDKSSDNSTGPKAYLNWLVFDRDFVLLNGGFKKMSDAAKEYGQDVAHEYLATPDINITQPGYVYIYLSNEEGTPVEVYFDDLKVTQVKSPVIQQDEYYPFGLTFNGYQRENSTKNNYLYNSKELQDELNIGWMDYGARMYMPEIGRWGVIDMLSESTYRTSPYTYAYNNPLRFTDPTGMQNEDEVSRNSYQTADGKWHLDIYYSNENGEGAGSGGVFSMPGDPKPKFQYEIKQDMTRMNSSVENSRLKSEFMQQQKDLANARNIMLRILNLSKAVDLSDLAYKMSDPNFQATHAKLGRVLNRVGTVKTVTEFVVNLSDEDSNFWVEAAKLGISISKYGDGYAVIEFGYDALELIGEASMPDYYSQLKGMATQDYVRGVNMQDSDYIESAIQYEKKAIEVKKRLLPKN